MTRVSTAVLTAWESAQTIEAHAQALRDATAAFGESTDSGRQTWSGLTGAYEGAAQETLWAGMDRVSALGIQVSDAGSTAADALEQFAADLALLRTRRVDLVSQVSSFNADFSQEDDSGQPPEIALRRANLNSALETLQNDYVSAVEICAARLNGISAEDPAEASAFDDVDFAAELRNTVPGALVGAATWGSTAMSYAGITTFSERRFVGHPNGTVTESFTPSRRAASAHRFEGSRLTFFGAAPGANWLQDQRTEVRRQAAAWNPRTGIHSDAAALRRTMRRDFVNSLPVVGEARALRERVHSSRSESSRSSHRTGDGGRVDTIERSSTTTTNSAGARGLNAAIRGTGTIGTVVGAGVTYENQKDYYRERNAQENPHMSAEEVERESTHDAAADTVGQTAATVATAAATGAAVGSFIPGAGTVVGAGLGLAVGLGSAALANANLLPDVNGDGEKDSIASAVGHGAKVGWDFIRGLGS